MGYPNGPRIRVTGDKFKDAAGRMILLRGVNLGGDCKVPYPTGGTHFPTDFSDHREVSFIGRPFPLAEADEHFTRLKGWGFNCLRLLTTWEAVEHGGPGIYDEAYLDYFAEICRRAGDYGLSVFVDFHQDVWSRMTGGDGAPGWIFDALGLDFTKFDAAGAAHVMQYEYDYAQGGVQEDRYPPMSWSSNYRLPANGILWTLFWGGALFTPEFRVDGRNVQHFLQRHYLGAMAEIARRVKDLPNILGFDTLNEPGRGWYGLPLSYRHMERSDVEPMPVRPGPAPSALDQLAAARGLPVTIPVLKRDRQTGSVRIAGETTLNEAGVTIWRGDCPFERAGAYQVRNGRAESLVEDFFQRRQGKSLDLSEDGYGPFFHAVARVTRAQQPDWAVFAELDPYALAVGRRFPRSMPECSVNAGHWYDTATLYFKTFDPTHSPDLFTGQVARSAEEIRARYVRQLTRRAEAGFEAPALIGEFGVPFDLDHGEAYAAWQSGARDSAIWRKQAQALALMYDAMDTLLLHATLWNYSAGNRNDPAIGDSWNQEDLSIFSRDQQGPNTQDGGRAVAGFCRPFARAVQGNIISMRYFHEDGRFELVLDADPDIAAPTEIFAPSVQFPNGFDLTLDGAEQMPSPEAQLVMLRATRSGRVTVTLRRIAPGAGAA